MARVKDWLMCMQSLAEEAIDQNLSEKEAVQYMIDNLDVGHSALEGTLRDVYRDVRDHLERDGP